jgi:uroporphyrinogen-III decarboxylase
MPYRPTGMTQTEFWEWDSKKFTGRKFAMNGPTTQQCLHSTPEELRKLTRKYIEITTKYTTAVIMPGCELSAYTPVENVKALIESARLSSAP